MGLTAKRVQGYYHDNVGHFVNANVLSTTVLQEINLGDEGSDYSYIITGMFHTPAPDTYYFRTRSDDSSKVWVNGQLVVDNGGLHGMRNREGRIDLSGPARVTITFGELGGGAGVKFDWRGGSQRGWTTRLGLFTPDAPVLTVALWNPTGGKYIRMNPHRDMDLSAPMGVSNLPSGWTWERFQVVDAGNGEVALWNKVHNRMVRMHSNGMMDASDHCMPHELPSGWTWERFTVVTDGEPNAPTGVEAFIPGKTILLHSKIHNRYVRMNVNSNDMDVSASHGPEEPTKGWTWERFVVVAG
jgi:hypothetical protein